MGFLDDFGDGFLKPWKWAYGKFDKADKLSDKVADNAGKVADSAGNALDGLGNLLGGNSNILLYGAIFVTAVVVLPVVLQKVL